MGFSNSSSSGSRLNRRSRRSKVNCMCEINVTPFVDVILVLLIVFMVSAPLLVNGVPINLPETQASYVPSESKSVTISLDENNQLYLNEQAMANKEQLLLALKQKILEPEKQQIFVHGAKTAAYEKILQLLAVLQQAGFKRLALASLPQQ
ncbi:biopolymer transporter ExbD [Bartonella sp. TP]|uniref:ExbD/TolR family protein n=1 Tax=Bartonella sp. TP TaxID=3057550 RepID=UPI0025B0966A|nr:biopolymer transporter ExbD [Bartonella sp. TP]WJW79634.1 biopolymer transporter ExbD [Bartonella sp. TP]